jgi:branched-chain amino acid aminotransferase
MAEITGTFFLEDRAYKDSLLFPVGIFDHGTCIYEVLRTLNGSCLFLEDHLYRLQASVKLSGYSYRVSLPDFDSLLNGLIRKNGFSEGNIRIVLHFTDGPLPGVYAYFIPHSYPSDEMYSQGVRAAPFKATRTHPNIKKIIPEIRARIAVFIEEQGIYDALLVDENENITEGSKTNVFFIKGQTVYTAPGDQVLRGITREKIFTLCKHLNINIIEKTISINSLHNYDAAFFTGTSPKVLPIRSIEGYSYAVAHPVLLQLMKAYNALITSYINR